MLKSNENNKSVGILGLFGINNHQKNKNNTKNIKIYPLEE